MKKILALIISLTMLLSFAIGSIAAANEDAFAEAVLNEEVQLALEKAAFEFSQGNDVEGYAAEEDVNSSFGKTQLGFHRLAAAVISAGWCPGVPSNIHKGTFSAMPMGCPICHTTEIGTICYIYVRIGDSG